MGFLNIVSMHRFGLATMRAIVIGIALVSEALTAGNLGRCPPLWFSDHKHKRRATIGNDRPAP